MRGCPLSAEIGQAMGVAKLDWPMAQEPKGVA
jgi:hypothetical protein